MAFDKWPKRIFYETKTYSLQGEIKLESGDTNVIAPFSINIAQGETVKLIKWSVSIGSGTSVTLKLQKSDGIGGSFADITGFTGLVVTGKFINPTESNPTNVALDDGVVLQPIVTAVSGTPTNMSINIIIEHTITG